MKNKPLLVHIDNQAEDVQYWRVEIPNNEEIKRNILNQCHAFPYSAHPGAKRTLINSGTEIYLERAD